MLAGVVEAFEGRIVAVVGGDDAIVLRPQRRFDLSQPLIERLEAGRVAGDVAPMTPLRVEVDEIDEDEPAARRCLERLEEKIDVAVVALALALRPGVAMGEDVADLADRDNRAAPAGRPLQEIAVRRGNREILAARSADEILGASADEGPRDDAPDVERIAQSARNPAEFIEPFEPEGFFVRGDLEDRVGRGVADGFPRS